MKDYQFKPDGEKALDRSPVQLKVAEGVREKLKSIPNWQDRLREAIDKLIAEHESSKPN
jgi:hypothetical protein